MSLGDIMTQLCICYRDVNYFCSINITIFQSSDVKINRKL